MIQEDQPDYLTLFRMRGSLIPFLNELIRNTDKNGKGFSIILLDLDRFKKYNDKFGHVFGDEVLKYVSHMLRLTFCEDGNHFFRYGGDELIIVIPNTNLQETYQSIRTCNFNFCHRPFLLNNIFYKITVSWGVAHYPTDGDETEKLIQEADKAMYFSKTHGRNRVTLANKIKHLRLRDATILLIILIVIVSVLTFAYIGMISPNIKNIFEKIRNLQVVTKPKDLTVITMKAGNKIEGYIVAEEKDYITFRVFLKKGEALMNIDRKRIRKIEKPESD